jgi:NtrC-family two-component system response regulator AlgB
MDNSGARYLLVGRALKAGRKRYGPQLLREAVEDSLLLESRSPAMQRLLENARHAARSNATILLTGESSTGKSMLARQIHLWSPRRGQPFSTIDSTRFSQGQIGSVLSGPSVEAPSLENQLAGAKACTIFFRSVDELHPALQSGLAHFVQDRTFCTPEGEKRVDVRIIASSNRDLLSEVKAHRFSEELFYSLSIVSLNVPPLCERPTDILPLASRMLAAAAIRNHRGDLQISPEAAAAMTLYRWPGNLRELRNAMEAAAVLCEGQTVSLAALPEAVANSATNAITAPSSETSLEEAERHQLLRVLAESATLEEAAATLGINVTTLWRKRKRYKLDPTTGWKLKRTVP